MARRFIPNPAFPAAVTRTTGVRDKLEEVAKAIAKKAATEAPDDPSTPASEDLHGSIRGEVVLTPEGYRGRVVAMNYKGMLKEFGTAEEPPDPFLRRSVEDVLGPDALDDTDAYR